MKKFNVLQFLAFEDLGSLRNILEAKGYEINIYKAGLDDTAFIADKTPLLILGGPIGVYETSKYPYLTEILLLLNKRLINNFPTFGICLGAQLIAKALGANVYGGHHKEIGWSKLKFTQEAASSPLRHLMNTSVLHWHGDTFDIPEGATRLASSDNYPNQAFSKGNNIMGLQFHFEVLEDTLESWLIGHACELSSTDLDINQLRNENHRYARDLEQLSPLVFDEWLNNLS